ncbi:winged helix-turn-helix domain-containing protein [Streptomyces sp. NRRL S-146]|uniref:winged helix-turn-helix domain-containing protein n=1 Tax=Streptomyces sp. NRRL S-146 TaxID=1463884 RepID=UPI0004CAF7D6|nr:winged helix-turn-helix domain-containing protein [Streptomyces sp. NRRL S-146]
MSPQSRSRQAVDMATGHVVQLEIFGEDDAQKKKQSVRYDWNPNPGRHANLAKALMQKVWDKDSGYDQNDRDILGFYIAHSPEGTEPLRMTFKEISGKLGVSQPKVSKSVGKLNTGGLLLMAEQIARIKFYRINPRAAFDGPAVAQVEAVKDARFPVVPAPEKAKAPTRARKQAATAHKEAKAS